jgi:hypothetical protein
VKSLNINVISLSKVDLSGRSEVASCCGFDEGRQKSRSMQQNSPANVQRSDEQMRLLYGATEHSYVRKGAVTLPR